jgi:hypothetical protein
MAIKPTRVFAGVLVVVVRWIDNAAADGFVKRLTAAMAEKG